MRQGLSFLMRMSSYHHTRGSQEPESLTCLL